MTITRPKLSDVLQQLIHDSGLTVTELARRTLVPQPTIQRITHGVHVRPHKKTLDVLAKYFSITYDQLCGFEPLTSSTANTKTLVNQIPIIPLSRVENYKSETNFNYLTVDTQVSANSFAVRMPDVSMEPMISKNSILIIDPEKMPQYRSFILVKLKGHQDILIRQLIKEVNNCYIRPLSQDFNQIELTMLKSEDVILGTVIEVRFICEEVTL